MLNITFHALTGTLIALTLNIFTLKYTQICSNTEHLNYTTQTSTDHIHSLAALQCSKYHYNKTNTPSRHTLMLLLLCGDTGAMVNPGRRHPKYAYMPAESVVRGPSSVTIAVSGPNTQTGIMSVASGLSHSCTLDCGSAMDVVYLISLAHSSKIPQLHYLTPSIRFRNATQTVHMNTFLVLVTLSDDKEMKIL